MVSQNSVLHPHRWHIFGKLPHSGASPERAEDNLEALSLVLFVECFVGERLGSAVSGGFVMYSGQAWSGRFRLTGKDGEHLSCLRNHTDLAIRL